MKYISIDQAEGINGIISKCKCDCGQAYKIETIDVYGNLDEVVVCDECYENASFFNQYK